ncbi:unnamed protein product [Gongylonema pulchrum]|uniref:FH2 domain-containing protein n=1 Tax=Gongylonema pulchrum TaxID=637853 RepID=A0A183ED31_9BILA|nr:unnamed protein product [Gongylonema pulchrum]
MNELSNSPILSCVYVDIQYHLLCCLYSFKQISPYSEKLFSVPQLSEYLTQQDYLQGTVQAREEELLESLSDADQFNFSVTTKKKADSVQVEPKAVELVAVDCPESMKPRVKELFPDEALRNITVLNLSQETHNDMREWNTTMEIEWIAASSAV